jgi:hypothetical protein
MVAIQETADHSLETAFPQVVDQVAQTFAAQVSDQSFFLGILPRRSWRHRRFPRSQACGTANELRTENAVFVTEEELWRGFERAGI